MLSLSLAFTAWNQSSGPDPVDMATYPMANRPPPTSRATWITSVQITARIPPIMV